MVSWFGPDDIIFILMSLTDALGYYAKDNLLVGVSLGYYAKDNSLVGVSLGYYAKDNSLVGHVITNMPLVYHKPHQYGHYFY